MEFIHHTEFYNDTCDYCGKIEKYTGHLCQNKACQKKLCRTVAHEDAEFGGRIDYTCFIRALNSQWHEFDLCPSCFAQPTNLMKYNYK